MTDIDAGVALTKLFDHHATREGRNEVLANYCPVSWAAYVDLLQRMQRDPKPRHFGGHVHVSSMVRPQGWNCDRYLFFDMIAEPDVDPVFSGPQIRCFEIGHGMELIVMKWIGAALKFFYGDGIEIHNVWFEKPIYKYSDESRGKRVLIGTADIVIDYTYRGKRQRVCFDAKSTSVNQQDKRTRANGDIEDSADYKRQLGHYYVPLKADWGALIYWEKQWSHRFFQSVVHRRDTMYWDSIQRLEYVRNDAENAEPSPIHVGGWCRSCPYRTTCQELQDAGI